MNLQIFIMAVVSKTDMSKNTKIIQICNRTFFMQLAKTSGDQRVCFVIVRLIINKYLKLFKRLVIKKDLVFLHIRRH